MKNKIIAVVTVIFFSIAAYLFYDRISAIDFEDVKHGFSLIRPSVVIGSILLVILNFLMLTSFDYFAFRTFGPRFMTYPKTIVSAFICYALTLNIGAFVGGLGFRYRIYSRWHVPTKTVPYIIASSIISNWSGYILLLSSVLLFKPMGVEAMAFIPDWVMTLLGIVGVLITGGYLYLCFKRYRGKFGKLDFQFPTLTAAIIQLVLSMLQWMILGLIIYLYLHELGTSINYGESVITILMSAIAGIITHIPAGMGVTENLFLHVGSPSEASRILVALICYRTVYYLLPLVISIPSYFLLELYQRKEQLGGHYAKQS